MEKYNYKTTGVFNDTCTEVCKVHNNGVMIGSAACRTCEHMLKSSDTITGSDWIICKKIHEATNSVYVPTFSTEPFDGYEYRFKFDTVFRGEHMSTQLYTDLDDVKEIKNKFIERVGDKVERGISFIFFRSKEDDENETELLNEILG